MEKSNTSHAMGCGEDSSSAFRIERIEQGSANFISTVGTLSHSFPYRYGQLTAPSRNVRFR